MITIITHIIVVIIVTWFCNTRKNVVFDVQKKWYNLPELGGWGGRGNSGNARKKTFFFTGGVPLVVQDKTTHERKDKTAQNLSLM